MAGKKEQATAAAVPPVMRVGRRSAGVGQRLTSQMKVGVKVGGKGVGGSGWERGRGKWVGVGGKGETRQERMRVGQERMK